MEKDNLSLEVNLDDFSIDFLKKNNQRLYYFGLGFIQLKLTDNHRVHFYTDQLDNNTDSIHNHRYDFSSKILKGTFCNKIFNQVKGSDYVLVNESCNPDIDAPEEKETCSVIEISKIEYRTNDIYQMDHKKFHQVSSKYAVTILERSDYKQEFAQIIYKKGEERNCPFKIKNEDSVLWEIIRSML
jgi:hypothetical protein